ncbi:MAG: hypothetical protein R3F59_28535 [Myxococcota bacterium]
MAVVGLSRRRRARRLTPPSSSAEPTIIGWGQDGAFTTGDNVNPHLAGSVFYFEGYAVYATRDVIDATAAGNPPPMKDAGDPASRVEPRPVSSRRRRCDMPSA